MTTRDAWLPISATIAAVADGTRAYLEAQRAANRNSMRLLEPIEASMKAAESRAGHFLGTYGNDAHPALSAVRTRFFGTGNALLHVDGDRIEGIVNRLGLLALLKAEVDFVLTDVQAHARMITERAFVHLSRTVEVDDSIGERWHAAFNQGETSLEKLGALHLLTFGIWSFKAHTEKARTDLVLGNELRANVVSRAAEGLVLTEWKRCTNVNNQDESWREARAQLKIYAAASLGGVELRDTRYAVVVSRKRLNEVSDLVVEGITYRHINIAIEPQSPSKASKARQPRAAPGRGPK